MDINAIIKQAIEQQVQAALNEAIEDMQLRFEGLRGHIANQMNDIGHRRLSDTEALLTRINELTADLWRWKGKQLEIPHSTIQNLYQTIEENVSQCASRDSFVELSREVEHLKRHVEALDHAKAKDDERFQDDVVSVLDQDNMDAKIREVNDIRYYRREQPNALDTFEQDCKTIAAQREGEAA